MPTAPKTMSTRTGHRRLRWVQLVPPVASWFGSTASERKPDDSTALPSNSNSTTMRRRQVQSGIRRDGWVEVSSIDGVRQVRSQA